MKTQSPDSQVSPPPPRPNARRRWRRVAATAFLLVAAVALLVPRIHPFFAISAPVRANAMIVEGWLPDYALEEALAEYRRQGYRHLFTTGGPLERGNYLVSYRSFAEVAAETFRKMGVPAEEIVVVPSEEKYRNRTFESAVSLRRYLAEHGTALESVNLVTQGTHARRSHFCFQRALGRGVSVGVISIPNRDYESDRWWRYSSGIKTILGESIAVLYAWLSIDYGD